MKKMKVKEKRKGRLRAANPKRLSEVLSDMTQVVPDHLPEESKTR